MGKKLTREEFIRRAQNVQAEKGREYNYSLVEYKNTKTKVKIICPEHGIFEQTPMGHLRGVGCPKCAGKKKLTTEEFIQRSQEIHENKYNYTKTIYKNIDSKVEIICPEHGSFWQRAGDHMQGIGCKQCGVKKRADKKRLSALQFIERAKKVHKNKYDYSQVNYTHNLKRVKIICPEHGVFEQTPHSHLYLKCGCPYCSPTKKKTTTDFIKKANFTHGNKYDYSLTIYKNRRTKVKIICPEHGVFEQIPGNHLNGHGCPKCAGTYMDKEYFVEKAREIHDDRYDYFFVNFEHSNRKVKIVCPVHGIFEQAPSQHIQGQGCPECAISGFKNNKPGVLYYFKDLKTDLYKIGITNSTISERFGHKNMKRIQLIKEWKFEIGQHARDKEQRLLEEFKQYRVTNKDWPEGLGGKTEFFEIDILKLDKENNESC